MGNTMTHVFQLQNMHTNKFSKQSESSVNDLNNYLKDEALIRDLGCTITARIPRIPYIIMNNLMCATKTAYATLEITKDGRVEPIQIGFYEYLEFHRLNLSDDQIVLHDGVVRPTNSSQYQNDYASGSIMNGESVDEEAICIICYESISQVTLWCQHGFCEQCCNDWFGTKKQTECPKCREPTEVNWILNVTKKIVKKKEKLRDKRPLKRFLNRRLMFLKIK